MPRETPFFLYTVDAYFIVIEREGKEEGMKGRQRGEGKARRVREDRNVSREIGKEEVGGM